MTAQPGTAPLLTEGGALAPRSPCVSRLRRGSSKGQTRPTARGPTPWTRFRYDRRVRKVRKARVALAAAAMAAILFGAFTWNASFRAAKIEQRLRARLGIPSVAQLNKIRAVNAGVWVASFQLPPDALESWKQRPHTSDVDSQLCDGKWHEGNIDPLLWLAWPLRMSAPWLCLIDTSVERVGFGDFEYLGRHTYLVILGEDGTFGVTYAWQGRN